MAWVPLLRAWFRSHVPAAQVRAHYRGASVTGRVRVSLTGNRRVVYRSRRTGRVTTAGQYRRWGPQRIAVERYREWLVEVWKPKRKPPPEPPTRREVWEVTWRQRTRNKGERGRLKRHDITVRLVARVPGRWTRDQVRGAFWRAHKRGLDALNFFDLEGINWQSGRGSYQYPNARVTTEEAMDALYGLIEVQGMEGLRVERVEET